MAALGQRKRSLAELGAVFAEFWTLKELRGELVDLLDVLQERVRLDARPIDPRGPVPLHSHATYGLYEIIAAHGVVGGVRFVRRARVSCGSSVTSRTCSSLR